MADHNYKFGFTLAEVLITLGIIGIVAAMTMPTLIAKHRAQALKAQFAKAYSIAAQQLLQAKTEFGVDKFQNYCVSYNAENNIYNNRDECMSLLNKQVKIVGKCDYKIPAKTYNKLADAYIDIGGTARPQYLLSDGTCYEARINSSNIGITIDINGSSKGPNALGHDIFVFRINENDNLTGYKMTGYLDDDMLENSFKDCNEDPAVQGYSACTAYAEQNGYPCTKLSSQKGNGLGCTMFAINNVCPEDPSKNYWECLP